MTPPAHESKPVRKALARAVRMRRADLDLTQDAVASKAKVDRKSVVQIEAGEGNPTLETVDRIARALSLTVEIQGAV